MYPTAEIAAIRFGIASDEEILAQSVVHVTSTDTSGDNSVYDPRMGPLFNERCITCGQSANDCVGHFGHAILFEHVVNPLYVARLVKIANVFCGNCGIAIFRGKTKIVPKFQTCSRCSECQSFISIDKEFIIWEQATEKTKPVEIFAKRLHDRVKKILMPNLLAERFQVHPSRMIFKVLPILPHMNRSSVNQGDSRSDDELTMQYLEIIKNNQKLSLAKKDIMKSYQKLVFSINVLINNSKGKAKHPSSCRVIKSFAERIAGKTGLMRSGVQGKRCDKSGRTVSAPGPELEHGQFGIPEHCAKILSRVWTADMFNLRRLQEFCDSDQVNLVERIVSDKIGETKPRKFCPPKFCNVAQTKLEPGDSIIRANGLTEKVFTGREIINQGDAILRKVVGGQFVHIYTVPASKRNFEIKLGDRVHVQLQNDDWILINRQPTLSSGSLQSGRVVIIPGFCCRIPLSSTKSYNMDFDGDENNLHEPQTDDAILDLKIADAREQIISASTGEPMIFPVQDSINGLYRMTNEIKPVNDYLINTLVSSERLEQIQSTRRKLKIVANKDTLVLVSACLDPRLLIDNSKFQVVCGVWICGVLTQSNIKKLIKITAAEFDNEVASDMISKMQKIAVKWLSCAGQTVSYADISALKREVVQYDADVRAEQGDDSRAIRDAQHNFVIQATDMGKNFRTCIESGAKGTMINLGQMLACVGQQHSKLGKLEPKMSGNRLFCHDRIEDGSWEMTNLERLERTGYIVSSFAHGLTPREFFIHAITSRDAVVDTATGTAGSGYLQHRIVKWGEDVYKRNGQLIYLGGPGQSKTLSLSYNDGKDPRKAQVYQPVHNIIRTISSF